MNFISRVFNKELNMERVKPFGDSITHLEYPSLAIYELIKETASKHPKLIAYDYFGKEVSYQKFFQKIEQTAKALKQIGIKKGDRVTICMPNTPEAIIMFYATNMVGATANMIHPLSSENEIEYYVEVASSKVILTITQLKNRVLKATQNQNINRIILTSVADSMPIVVKTAYEASQVIKKVTNRQNLVAEAYDESNVISWQEFLNLGYAYSKKDYMVKGNGASEAVILYSGGTTGKPKGVRLSNNNVNTMALQAVCRIESAIPGNSVLSILPIFHGFGLACCIHTVFVAGMKSYLIPQFKPSELAKMIKKKKPNLLAGVPTLYEALINSDEQSKTYLKSVIDCICGGDILKSELRKRVNTYLAEHGSKAQIRVGYGLTESVAVVAVCPSSYYKEGAVGLPMPDTFIKIVKPGTFKECRVNKKGEICVYGPSQMMGYLNEPEETRKTLVKHSDGKTWLHTGDIGYKNQEGIIFFESRLKRLIITSGYNVYPQYMEELLALHPAIEAAVVVGVPHPYKKQVPVANIVLKSNYYPSEDLNQSIKNYLQKSVAKYAMPIAYEYIKSVPKTLIGKVNYKKLEEECTKKYGKVKK
ncbi:MAG: acyl--CoA ligase [Mollicutes bacterium]|nr:acyl--CoA ligase [Mollicutes bacterium]